MSVSINPSQNHVHDSAGDRSRRMENPLFSLAPIPPSVGIGLRHPHIEEFLTAPPDIGWLEIHSENYLVAGGPRIKALEKIRQDFPLSCHGVGLSLGSAEGLSTNHLQKLRRLFDYFAPGLISEHVAWSAHQGRYLNDLLPLPYTEEALAILCRNIDHAQTVFGRQILIENPSSYIQFQHADMPEWEFMAAAVRRTGCGLLLDVNNIHVSAHNHDFSALGYVDAMPLDAIQEIHIAGHFIKKIGDATILIDDHGAVVSDPVWDLLHCVLAKKGGVPILVEWDTNIPDLSVLLEQAQKAQHILDQYHLPPAAHILHSSPAKNSSNQQ